MKIIQIIQKPQLRGAEIFACQLSNHLVSQGNEVLVVTIFKGESILPFSGEIINLDRPLSKRLLDLKGWKKLAKIVNQYNPDIIQANASDTLKYAVSSKILFRWNSPIVFRNANKMGDFINSKLKWVLNKFYLSKIDYVISVSNECEKDFIKTFRYPSNKINTVEIGVENCTLGDVPDNLKFIYEKGPVVVHIGGFVREKNHIELIDIFAEILVNHPTAQLLLIGKGRLESEIRYKVKTLKIDDNVHFLGYRNDVLDILFNSQAFVLPSLIEGLPGVILEAMYCEVPVVAYKVGGIGEILKSNKTGYSIEKNEKDEFVSALNAILLEEKEISRFRKNAKNQVITKFMNSHIATRFSNEYLKIISKNY